MIEQQIIQDCLLNKSYGHSKLYNLCAPYVYSIVKRYIKDPEERKDQLQEVFASVFSNMSSFDQQRGNFKSWIARITVNQCLMHLRKSKKMTALNIVEITHIHEPSEEIDMNGITRDDIEKILDKMPQGYKIVFMLYVMDGYSHKEIESMIGISKETSRSQLSRAKNWIRKNFKTNKNTRTYGIF